MLLHAITSRKTLLGDDQQQQAKVVRLAAEWARKGIDYIQIREKDLDPVALRELAAAIVHAVRAAGGNSRVLLNGPAQMALDTGCDGVHLPGNASADEAEKARALFHAAKLAPVISAACHSPEDAGRIPAATMLLFAPVFEKKLSGEEALPGAGLEALRQAVQAAGSIPIFALGGVTWENATQCKAAGAAGIAGIRLFLDALETKITTVQKPLR